MSKTKIITGGGYSLASFSGIGVFSNGTSEREDLKMYVRKGDVLSGTAYVRLKSLKYIPYKIC